MSGPGRSHPEVLLINSPRHLVSVKSAVHADMRPPLGLMYIAAYLREKGVLPEILDAEVGGVGVSGILQVLAAHRPRVIGLNCHTLNRHTVYELAKAIRGLWPDSLVILGGAHPSLAPIEVLKSCPEVDAVVVGEGEETFYELSRGDNLEDIAGLAFNGARSIQLTIPRARVRDLDNLPLPNPNCGYRHRRAGRGRGHGGGHSRPAPHYRGRR